MRAILEFVLTEKCSNAMCAIWNSLTEPTWGGTRYEIEFLYVSRDRSFTNEITEGNKFVRRWDIPAWSRTSVACARSDSFERITWQNISPPTLKLCRTIVRSVTEVFKGKSRWGPTFRTSTSANTTWWSLALCAIIVQQLWSASGYIFSTG